MLQEGPHETRERRHPALLVQHGEHVLGRDRPERDAVLAQPAGEVGHQPARPLFVAEGLNQRRPVPGVEVQLPVARRRVRLPVDERRRVPGLREREVLDVDARLGQVASVEGRRLRVRRAGQGEQQRRDSLAPYRDAPRRHRCVSMPWRHFFPSSPSTMQACTWGPRRSTHASTTDRPDLSQLVVELLLRDAARHKRTMPTSGRRIP